MLFHEQPDGLYAFDTGALSSNQGASDPSHPTIRSVSGSDTTHSELPFTHTPTSTPFVCTGLTCFQTVARGQCKTAISPVGASIICKV
jgi:hypothetical protein